MRFQTHSRSTNPRHSMSAMIDVVFLLLIFFMLTLQIVEPEGVHAVDTNRGGGRPDPRDAPSLEIKVRLVASEDGRLADVRLGSRSLGSGSNAIRQLGREIRSLARDSKGLDDDGLPVRIEADASLNFEYTLRALGACQKRRQPDGTLELLGTRVQLVSPQTGAE